jgi:hypothetical protein
MLTRRRVIGSTLVAGAARCFRAFAEIDKGRGPRADAGGRRKDSCVLTP